MLLRGDDLFGLDSQLLSPAGDHQLCYSTPPSPSRHDATPPLQCQTVQGCKAALLYVLVQQHCSTPWLPR